MSLLKKELYMCARNQIYENLKHVLNMLIYYFQRRKVTSVIVRGVKGVF